MEVHGEETKVVEVHEDGDESVAYRSGRESTRSF